MYQFKDSYKNLNYDKQTIEVPGTRILRHQLTPDALISRPWPEVGTIYEAFQYSLKRYPARPLLGHRPFDKSTKKYGDYVWQTYSQINERVNNLGSGICFVLEKEFGFKKIVGSTLGVWSLNRPEFHIVNQVAAALNLKTVPLYETLGPNIVKYCVNHAEIHTIVLSANHIRGLFQIRSEIPTLKCLISMDPLEDIKLKNEAKKYNLTLYEIDEVESIGREHPYPHNPPKPKDCATIMYTSGTTGPPKGTILTHENFVASMACFILAFRMTQDDVVISYLPLPHIFGRALEEVMVAAGGSIGYFHGDPNELLLDSQVLKPTVFPGVPRIWNKVYQSLAAATIEAPGKVGELLRMAVAEKLKNLEETGELKHPVWDEKYFKKCRMAIGGQVRLLITGAAPIGIDVLQFLRIAFSAIFVEGYGQTENAAATTMTLYGDNKAGSVGTPHISSEIKLIDVPEMQYTSKDKPYPRGELCARGPNVMFGYYKDEKKTRAAIDEEGWLHSGDICQIDDRGCIVIVDRIKHIFKLSNGEYIAPEKIEQIYLQVPLIAQFYVHGDSLRKSLVGIIVPNPELFIPWAQKAVGGGENKHLQELSSNKQVQKALVLHLNQVGKQAGLNGFEQVKAIYIDTVPFSVENDLLTPTFKNKRQKIWGKYRKEIDRLYAELKENDGAKL
ncbi:401_t:CDS:10 [Ambispora gerdemannii]|uniref:401_t:CDS:1 n=1 Tax=Ambispora gerdemannii TaxID=144530 RepID=A0A9N8W6C2_9GLOM|nr:401_t:CDS:10 [Ambispora gerdemannii]